MSEFQVPEGLSKIEGSHIFCGDSLEVMRKMPSKSFHLVFTSPPYAGAFRNYNKNGQPHPSDIGRYDPYHFINEFMSYVHQIARLLRHEDGGVFILNIGEKYLNGFASKYPHKLMLRICEETDLDLIDEIPWVKADAMPNKNTRVGTLGWEHIFVFGSREKKIIRNLDFMKSPYRTSKLSISLRRDYKRMRNHTNHPMNDVKCFDDIGALPRNYLVSNQERLSLEEYEYLEEHYCVSATQSFKGSAHMAQMPIHLAEYFVGGFSHTGHHVLDCFGGSGTTAAAAWSLNREFVCIDLFEDNCELIQKRVDAIPRRRDLFNYYGIPEDAESVIDSLKKNNQMESQDLF